MPGITTISSTHKIPRGRGDTIKHVEALSFNLPRFEPLHASPRGLKGSPIRMLLNYSDRNRTLDMCLIQMMTAKDESRSERIGKNNIKSSNSSNKQQTTTTTNNNAEKSSDERDRSDLN